MASHALSRPGAGLVRAFLMTWICVVISACAHSVATGAAPSSGAVAIGTATASLLIATFTRRRLSVRAGTGTLAALQVGLHAFFTAVMPARPAGHSMVPMTHAGMARAPAWPALIPSAPMLCAHIVAAAVVAWLLHGADIAIGRALELARLRTADAVSLVRRASHSLLVAWRRSLDAAATRLPDRRTVSEGAAAPPSSAAGTLLSHEVTRRGPPRWAAAPG
ncbi:hypothetical protein [Streptomyces sp. NBC_01268]|uniref:hypothetical protein n=1 Tax=Streptomyces sp. NBC_01268 TaxID=2903806 RepID=UPI002E34A3D4|nr:hypothetical protein [Streptomyces sp. NBC_01268]